MTLIGTVEALVDATSMAFTGLDGDVDGIYHMEFYVKQALSQNYSLEFNDDTTGNSKRHTVNSSAASFGSTIVLVGAQDDEHEGRIVINAPRVIAGVAKVRKYRNDGVYFDDSGAAIFARLYVGEWNNSIDNITKLAIVSGGIDGIKAGSWARLYKYPTS